MRLQSLSAVVGILAVATVGACAAAPRPGFTADDQCPDDARVVATAELWAKRMPIPALELKSGMEARCFKHAFLRTLTPRLGALVGYKVGLYSNAARAAYKTDRPRLGYLYDGMLVASGADIPAAYGIAGTWESDLLLVVKDDGINTATGREGIYRHIRGYRPFIELPDRNYAPDVAVTAEQVEALNVGARKGVIGAEVPLPQTAEAMVGLVNFTVDVTVTDADGVKTESGKALTSLGDVLEIVQFARDRVLAEGHRLKAGDLISIGVVTPAGTPVQGQKLAIRYHVLPADSTVSVNFR